MSKNGKLLLGVATFLPVLLGIILQAKYMQVMLSEMPDMMESMSPGNPFGFFHQIISRVFTPAIITMLVFCIIMYIGLMIFYIRHAVKYPFKSEGDKVMWILLFVLVGYIAFIIYYFLKIYPDKKEDPLMNTNV